jgi:hypothetical protein
MLKTRSGVRPNGTFFVCVGELQTTVRNGDISQVPIRDTPPENFVCDLCTKLNVQILFGGDDVMGLPCPMISNKDILSFGGTSRITSGKIFIEFVLSTLERKYSKENASQSVLNKIDSFGEHGKVFDSSRCILIWTGQHEGLTLPEAHRVGNLIAVAGRVLSRRPTVSRSLPPMKTP